MATEIERLSGLDAVLSELARLRTENRELRRTLTKRRRYSNIVRRALVDAHTLLLTAYSDQSTGIASMCQRGMSRRRWEWAVAFLRFAGVVGVINQDWRNGLSWLITDLEQAIVAVETAATELDQENGYRRLRVVLYGKRRV